MGGAGFYSAPGKIFPIYIASCTMEQVMKGNFTKLPPNDSNVVRVFLSSTFGGEQTPKQHVS